MFLLIKCIDFNENLHVDINGDEISPPVPATAREYLEIDYRGFCDFAEEVDGPPIWHCCNWARNTDLSDGLELPITLLSGPWSEDMLKYLFWLVRSGAQIDWIGSTLGEVSQTALFQSYFLLD